ncbi:MAG: response regulator [Proteobacteria bacterium]|nr:response regulator [Pseudomonadota bacterium]
MNDLTKSLNNRVLVIDDNEEIHSDFRSILEQKNGIPDLQSIEADLFGDSSSESAVPVFDVDVALQGKEGHEKVKNAVSTGQPYSIAFVDMRMPPGWDGLETIENLWQADPNLEIVICTAYSDYSWDAISEGIGKNTDKLLILKKPFDAIELQQIATALSRKWQLGKQARIKQDKLEELVSIRTKELREAEETVRHSERRWRSLLENAPNLVFIVDREGKIEFINHFAGSHEKKEAIGRKIYDFIDFSYHNVLKSRIEKTFRIGNAEGCTIRGIGPEGENRWYEVQTGIIKQNEQIASVSVIATDVTQQREIEAQLLQSQKIEAIGRLAGGVAHDINNILGAIMGSASALNVEASENDLDLEDIQNILRACRKGSRLTSDLLGFARKGKYIKEEASINKIVTHIREFLKHSIAKKINIATELDENIACIEVDISQIENVLMNICINAADAMKTGGELTITTKNIIARDSTEDAMIKRKAGRYVQMQVTDTGIGMDRKTKARVFEPFFTTKPQGQGTGLGLAMVYGVIKNHGGDVTIESEPGNGTIVTILLPSLDYAASRQLSGYPKVVPLTEAASKRSCILLVDDENLLLKSTRRLLEKMGYLVFLAENGREAFEIYREQQDRIDLVILDMIMPEMDGPETFKLIRELNPKAKIIISSGYSKDEKVEVLLGEGAVNFLHKPFDINDLSEKLKEAFI